MKISYNWLNEFIDLKLSPEETSEKLTLIGLEVDEVLQYGNKLDGVVVGHILEVNEHPNADRLVLCTVDLGSEQVQIACGAPNVAGGQKVPVATVGTTLPVPLDNGKPFTIKKAKLRGERSEGMICSEQELGLGDDHSGIMVLNDDIEVGTPIFEALDLTTDTVFDIELTPNRPDAACHLGVARDLSAALNIPLKKPFQTKFNGTPPDDSIDIAIENSDKCHRYVGKIVKDVEIAPSPNWLQEQLQAIGIRPVNNVVDVTNFVMFEMGQPLHAFDMDKLNGAITIKDFDDKITFQTLDHVERSCPSGTLFICDDDGPIAIAGVMGGVDSEVGDTTTNLLIESAYFDPASIRKTAKQQGLQTDASYRFERGIDPTIQHIAGERAAELITDLAGGTANESYRDTHPVKYDQKLITLRKDFTNRILGTEFTLDKITDLLSGLGFTLSTKTEGSVTYLVPPFRPDLEREIDLIEEVGRLYDYNNISTPDKTDFIAPEPLSDWELFKTTINETVKSLRFKEIYSNSLIPEDDAALVGSTDEMLHTLNPITADMTTLRPSLRLGFLQSAAYNFNRNAKEIRFFETGHVFKKDANGTYYPGIGEEEHLLIGLSGLKQKNYWNTTATEYDFFDLKAIIESLLTSLHITPKTAVDDDNNLNYFIGEQKIGTLFAIDEPLLNHFDIDYPTFVAEFSMNALFNLGTQKEEKGYTPISKYPTFEFDFAVVVDANLRAQNLLDTITETAKMLDNIEIFDLFEGESIGENKKSIAFKLSFLDKNKTLTINDIEPIIENVLNVLDKKYSATLRDY